MSIYELNQRVSVQMPELMWSRDGHVLVPVKIRIKDSLVGPLKWNSHQNAAKAFFVNVTESNLCVESS